MNRLSFVDSFALEGIIGILKDPKYFKHFHSKKAQMFLDNCVAEQQQE